VTLYVVVDAGRKPQEDPGHPHQVQTLLYSVVIDPSENRSENGVESCSERGIECSVVTVNATLSQIVSHPHNRPRCGRFATF